MAQQGFLLVADITGHTMFLTRSAPDGHHRQADGETHAARKRWHASVVALREAQRPQPVATVLVRMITRLPMAKKLVSDQRASKVALERLVVEETAAFT